MNKIIAVNNLHKSFGETEAVKGIDFHVETGSSFAFLGQNGAGKSTTINIILGLLKPDQGGVDYGAFGSFEEFKQNIGVVFQNNVFDDNLSVEENLLLYGQLYLKNTKTVKTRFSEICELLCLEEYAKKRFKTLSGGQKRKAEIARALFNTPRILFLDEPTTGLDPKTRAEMWTVLNDIQRKSKMTIFLTTHYMEETVNADKVVIIHRGQRVCQGSPAELKAKYSHDKLLVTPNDARVLENTLTEQGFEFKRITDTYMIKIHNSAASIDLLYSIKDNVRYYESIKGSMDDVFLNAVGEDIGGDK